MSNQRYDDEILSAIIDDEADAETVAAVAADDLAASRLAHMRQAVEIVAEEPAPATAERRAASIAAALAAATPAAEVSSLATKRQERVEEKKKRSLSTGWVAAAAAVVAFLIAIPIGIGLLGSDRADFASDAADSASYEVTETESATASADDAAEDTVEEVVEGAAESVEAMSTMDETAEEEAMDEASEEEAALAEPDEDRSPATTIAATVPADLARLFSGNTPEIVLDAVADGLIPPQFSAADVLDAGVNPECLGTDTTVTNERPYALVNLSPFGGADRLILIEFADDGMSRALDAEDCSPLG